MKDNAFPSLDAASRRAQIRWRCRRGLLELDIQLSQFFDRYYDKLSEKQQQAFAHLLTYSDPDLMAWLSQHILPDDL